jgi:hypothetical protein
MGSDRDAEGEEAKKANEALVMGKKVRLEYDVQKKDKYGRTLAYVFVRENNKEIMVQTELLRRGLAFLYTLPPNVRYVDVFLAAQKEARANKAGIGRIHSIFRAPRHAIISTRGSLCREKLPAPAGQTRWCLWRWTASTSSFLPKTLVFFEREGVHPAQDYVGRRVNIFGLIKSYRGSPEIIVSHPWQIEILDRP